eukprot:CAMPEP_0181132876 /NCGR_PEP_ID=MMETSP1071-20121207/31235_1 /TAXON_ID=35127 /ORGANISM="Thalassiosira sp., Strain NH16" /LENGTH=308 /DNA_ID=CAMNT_0023219251 /DNA_START=151 /DNA_END=1077 /DNA_ORIENTATION=-
MTANNGGSIKIVGASVKVVDHDGLTITEAIGNVATTNDDLSVGLVTVAKPTSEPWLTLRYDEYIHVTEGYVEMHYEKEGDGSDGANTVVVTRVEAGQTAFVPDGTRFRPVFPVPARYIPVCLPAFRPDRCIREEGTEASDVSAKLDELHNPNNHKMKKELTAQEDVNTRFDDVRKIYHMCQTSLYEKCVSEERAYFPPTFVQDGRFTHATAVPSDLVSTANHFYTKTAGDWICLEIDRDVLENEMGIVTVFECARPVGDIDTDEDWKGSTFPHIFGGIPAHVDGVVTKVYEMKRSEEGKFLSIEGLVE